MTRCVISTSIPPETGYSYTNASAKCHCQHPCPPQFVFDSLHGLAGPIHHYKRTVQMVCPHKGRTQLRGAIIFC